MNLQLSLYLVFVLTSDKIATLYILLVCHFRIN
jgi:hypothetical protein